MKIVRLLTWNFQKNMEFCLNFKIVSWCYPALLYLSHDLFRYAWWKRGAVWNYPKGKKPLPETSISVHQMSGDAIYQVFISSQYAQHHTRVSSKVGPLCWMATGRTWKGNWLILFFSIRWNAFSCWKDGKKYRGSCILWKIGWSLSKGTI